LSSKRYTFEYQRVSRKSRNQNRTTRKEIKEKKEESEIAQHAKDSIQYSLNGIDPRLKMMMLLPYSLDGSVEVSSSVERLLRERS